MSYGVQSAGLFGSSQQTTDSTSLSLRSLANLDLTEDQRTQIRSILKAAKSQGLSQTEIEQEINAILTTSQQTTFQSDIASQTASSSSTSDSSSTSGTSAAQGPPPGPPPGGNPFADPNGPFANLDLTSSQQSQIATILKNGQSQGLTFDQINAQINAVLTTSQQTTFATDLENLPAPPTVQNAQDLASGQSQTGSGDASSSSSSTATLSNGLTEADIQKQIAAAASLILKQLESDLGVSS
jgi:Spy/CpxP family protein refolding chaperone